MGSTASRESAGAANAPPAAIEPAIVASVPSRQFGGDEQPGAYGVGVGRFGCHAADQLAVPARATQITRLGADEVRAALRAMPIAIRVRCRLPIE